LQQQAVVGARALVPFGKKKLTGVIVGLPAESNVRGLKPVTDILEISPSFSGEMIKLTRWIAEYYIAPWGEVLRAATPQGRSLESKRIARLAIPDIEDALAASVKTAPKQHALLRVLHDAGAMSVPRLQKKLGARNINSLLNETVLKGWVIVEEQLDRPRTGIKVESIVSLPQEEDPKLSSSENGMKESRTTKQQSILDALKESSEPLNAQALLKKTGSSLSTLRSLEKKGLVIIARREVIRSSEYEDTPPSPPLLTLNRFQEEALKTIKGALESGTYRTFLLHGITGSGKTQVYIEAIRHSLERGKTAVVLVPEISLTPQTVRRFKAHFGADVAVMHSQMSVGERYDAWRLAQEGRIRIVIGPRSAIFAPLKNVGLIVVDEEHEASYKQFDATP
ncbi:MAG: DEAD/DEAH box helicase family protein, partial [Bacteroidota bacterium]